MSGVYKELALLELFLRNNSRNSRDRQVLAFMLFFSSFFDKQWFRVTITLAKFLQKLVWLKLTWDSIRCLAIQI